MSPRRAGHVKYDDVWLSNSVNDTSACQADRVGGELIIPREDPRRFDIGFLPHGGSCMLPASLPQQKLRLLYRIIAVPFTESKKMMLIK
jgi:hypothetical protein